MKVFHGSDRVIQTPIILEPNRALDFGKGVYTTLNEMQAERFAQKVKDRLHAAVGMVNVYDVDMERMRAELSCLWFNSPDEDWLDYVSDNRNGINTKAYDFVYGSVANVIYCIEEYKRLHGTTGRETYELFEHSGASRYILEHYDALHTAGIEYTLGDIEGMLG